MFPERVYRKKVRKIRASYSCGTCGIFVGRYAGGTLIARIGIIGSGVVGFAIGRGFIELGNKVLFFDVDKNKINALNKQGFLATADIRRAAKNCDAFFVTVPTPDKGGEINLSMIKSAITNLSRALKSKKGYFLIVIKSTVVPATTEKLVNLIERHSGKKAGRDFGVCFNPEFLRDNHSYEDFMDPDRIVVGGYDKKSGDTLENLYSSFGCPVIRTDLRTAEMTKYANNCFYATKISFFNEIHLMCQKLGIDSDAVRRVVQLDRFYGTHPWEHGHSFGGKCLPKDLNAIIHQFNEGHIHNPVLLKAVRDVNEMIE